MLIIFKKLLIRYFKKLRNTTILTVLKLPVLIFQGNDKMGPAFRSKILFLVFLRKNALSLKQRLV